MVDSTPPTVCSCGQASRYWIERLDGFGASWLHHHMNYCCEPPFIRKMIGAGLDLTKAERPSSPTVRKLLALMRTCCRLMAKPDHLMVHFAHMYGCARPTYLHMASAFAHIEALQVRQPASRIVVDTTAPCRCHAAATAPTLPPYTLGLF